jgi:hypothetical protein
MRSRVGAVLERPVAKAMCKHHWIIEPASGPTSRGVCKLCGEVKLFDNVLADLLSASDSFTPFNIRSSKDEDEDEENATEAE